MKASSLLAVIAIAEAKSAFTFDWYYSTCNSAISKNAAITSQCRASRQRGPSSCNCKLGDWQLSMYNCLHTAAEMEGTGERAIRDTWTIIEDFCHKYGEFPTVDDMKPILDSNPVTQSFKEANTTKSGPFKPNPKVFTKETLEYNDSKHWQSYYSEIFGATTVWYLAGVMLVQSCLHWTSFLLPTLIRLMSNNPVSKLIRRHVVLPALFNKHRATPMKVGRYFMLCFPPRLHVVFFIPYLFMSIFFLAYHYPWVNGDDEFQNYTHMVAKHLSYRSGQLGMYKMAYVYLFAGRNNILIWLTGWQFEIFNHWHRWIARLCTVDIFIHTVAYTIDITMSHGRSLSQWYERFFMRWGVVGLVAMCLLCVNGTKSLRQLWYELFLYLHIALAVLTIVGSYYHITVHAGWEKAWAVIGIWAFDRVIRLARIVIANPLSKSIIKAHPGGTMEVTINYSGLWKPGAGTYVYIHFLNSYHAFQSHPFTVVAMEKRGQMKLFCKAQDGLTKKMYKSALNNGGEYECRVLVEGPYGVHFSTKQYKEVVLIAGGIGITAIYSHLQYIVKSGENQIVHIHWAIPNTDALSWFKTQLDEMLTHTNVHAIVHLNEHSQAYPLESPNDSFSSEKKTDKASESAVSISNLSINRTMFRADFRKIVGDHITNCQGDILFFVCGPAMMSDDVRAGVANNLFQTRHFVQFYEESFSM